MTSAPTGHPIRFGKYLLLRKLAQGGMAELFLARDEAGREVVLKRVLPHFSAEHEFLAMFLNEARIAAQLDHPGIVRVFDLGMEGPNLFIAMEYVDGFDLESILDVAGGRIPVHLAARVIQQVCEALHHAHQATGRDGRPLGIVHRDVTPGNVMLSRGGAVKLVDFGIAKATAQLERTRPGVIKGKFNYLAPEQVEAEDPDARSDVWAAGLTLYELITGSKPFERTQVIETMREILEWTPPSPADLFPDCPRGLSDLVMKALQKSRDRRFRTAREMAQALEAQLARLPPSRPSELAAFIRDLERGPALERRGAAGPRRDAPEAALTTDPGQAPVAEPALGEGEDEWTTRPGAAGAPPRKPREERAPRPGKADPEEHSTLPLSRRARARHAEPAERERPAPPVEEPPAQAPRPPPKPAPGKAPAVEPTRVEDPPTLPPRPAPKLSAARLPAATEAPEAPARTSPPPVGQAPAEDEDPTLSTSGKRPAPEESSPGQRGHPGSGGKRAERDEFVPGHRRRAAQRVLVAFFVLLCLGGAAAGWVLREIRQPAEVPEQLREEVSLAPRRMSAPSGTVSFVGASGAEIVIGGETRCKVPCSLELPEGVSVVSARVGKSWVNVDVSVVAGQRTEVRIAP